MGTSASDRKEELEAFYLKKKMEKQLELEKLIFSERRAKQHAEYVERQSILKYNKLAQNIQNSLDNQRRNDILKKQHYVGYNLNPYSMSSSELEYWWKEINKEIERMHQQRFNNLYTEFGCKFNNFI